MDFAKCGFIPLKGFPSPLAVEMPEIANLYSLEKRILSGQAQIHNGTEESFHDTRKTTEQNPSSLKAKKQITSRYHAQSSCETILPDRLRPVWEEVQVINRLLTMPVKRRVLDRLRGNFIDKLAKKHPENAKEIRFFAKTIFGITVLGFGYPGCG